MAHHREGAAGPGRPDRAKRSRRSARKLEKGDFNLDDFRKQFQQMAKMGGMKDMMNSMPGMGDIDPGRRRPRRRRQAHPGHDRLDDEAGTQEPRHHRPEPAPPHRRRAAAPSRTTSSSSSISSTRCAASCGKWPTCRMLQTLKMITGMGKAGMLEPGGMMPKTRSAPAIARRRRSGRRNARRSGSRAKSGSDKNPKFESRNPKQIRNSR